MTAITIGWGEVILLLVVVILLFGSSRLPKLARSLRGLRRDVKQGWEDE